MKGFSYNCIQSISSIKVIQTILLIPYTVLMKLKSKVLSINTGKMLERATMLSKTMISLLKLLIAVSMQIIVLVLTSIFAFLGAIRFLVLSIRQNGLKLGVEKLIQLLQGKAT